jgi:hypothetical protein
MVQTEFSAGRKMTNGPLEVVEESGNSELEKEEGESVACHSLRN